MDDLNLALYFSVTWWRRQQFPFKKHPSFILIPLISQFSFLNLVSLTRSLCFVFSMSRWLFFFYYMDSVLEVTYTAPVCSWMMCFQWLSHFRITCLISQPQIFLVQTPGGWPLPSPGVLDCCTTSELKSCWWSGLLLVHAWRTWGALYSRYAVASVSSIAQTYM